MDNKLGILLADCPDKKGGRVRLENTSHVLDAEDINVEGDELLYKIEVVLKVVLLLGVLGKQRLSLASRCAQRRRIQW